MHRALSAPRPSCCRSPESIENSHFQGWYNSSKRYFSLKIQEKSWHELYLPSSKWYRYKLNWKGGDDLHLWCTPPICWAEPQDSSTRALSPSFPPSFRRSSRPSCSGSGSARRPDCHLASVWKSRNLSSIMSQEPKVEYDYKFSKKSINFTECLYILTCTLNITEYWQSNFKLRFLKTPTLHVFKLVVIFCFCLLHCFSKDK